MNWKKFNFDNFWVPMIFFMVGIVAGILFPRNSKPSKDYPIEVQTFWNSGGYQSYPTMRCDSIHGDTLYRDGLRIVNKNIINVSFN
jgi:hypothetical protein